MRVNSLFYSFFYLSIALLIPGRSDRQEAESLAFFYPDHPSIEQRALNFERVKMRKLKDEEKRKKMAVHPGPVLKKMRLAKGVSPKNAAKIIGRSLSVLKRFEKREVDFSRERINQLLRGYRYTQKEFGDILEGRVVLPEISPKSIYRFKGGQKVEPRKYKKEITKEARVLKALRHMSGFTQPQAAERCGWHRSSIDHRENGRTDLKPEEIRHVIKAYGRTMEEFKELLEQPILRDEAIEKCTKILNKIDSEKLQAVQALLENFR